MSEKVPVGRSVFSFHARTDVLRGKCKAYFHELSLLTGMLAGRSVPRFIWAGYPPLVKYCLYVHSLTRKTKRGRGLQKLPARAFAENSMIKSPRQTVEV